MAETPARMTFKESRPRSIIKSFVYRLMSILGTGVLTWIITGDAGKTFSITAANQVFLVALYYLSERFWNRVHWGRDIRILPD